MATEFRIEAIVPMGDDQLANAAIMNKIAVPYSVFSKALASICEDASIQTKLVKVRAPKLATLPAQQPNTDPPAELKLEVPEPPAPAERIQGTAPWLQKKEAA